MQASHSSVPTSALTQSRPHLSPHSSLRPMYAAEFRGKLESVSGRQIEWGYWTADEQPYGSYECLILKADTEPLFRKADFVMARSESVQACLKCVDTTPEPEALLELFLEADTLCSTDIREDLRVGFFCVGGQLVKREDLEKALRASGLTEVELLAHRKESAIWYFTRSHGKWILTSCSIEDFIPGNESNPPTTRRTVTPPQQNIADVQAFHKAVREGEMTRVNAFLKSGLDVSLRDDRFNSALHIAAAANQVACIQCLLGAGASWKALNYKSRTPLHVAAANASAEALACLLDAGADPDVLMDRGISPLHMASWFGHADMVHLLIQSGASINLLNEDGNSCLHLAAGNGQVKIVKTLIGFGADPALINHRGLTYLEVINEGYSGPAIPVI